MNDNKYNNLITLEIMILIMNMDNDQLVKMISL